jgi:CDP-diglyceride synthetase
LVGYLQIVGVAAAAAAPGWWLQSTLDVPPGWSVAVVVSTVCVLFGVLGSFFGLITRADWQFARDWVRLKMLK